jgi:hypothetical protein
MNQKGWTRDVALGIRAPTLIEDFLGSQRKGTERVSRAGWFRVGNLLSNLLQHSWSTEDSDFFDET